MKKRLLVLSLFVIFLIPTISAQVLINEIMPHTNNSWNNEWVELYNPTNDTLNISLWKIGDKSSNDTFSLIIYSKSFALIVDDSNSRNNLTGCGAFNISNESCFQLANIGSGLNDENESIFLYNSSNISTDSFSWQDSIKSLGKSFGLKDSNWSICEPTPGQQNNCTITQNQSQGNETNESNQNQNNQSNELEQETSSEIKITDFPEEAKFGDTIEVKVKIYRGDTNKYAVYVYVEKDDDRVSEKVTVHADSKYSTYRKTLDIDLDCKNESGDYKIIVEGLDERDTETIYIESCYKSNIDNVDNTEDLVMVNTTSDSYNYNTNNQFSSNPITGSAIREEQMGIFSLMKVLPFILGIFVLGFLAYFLLKKS